MEAESVRVVELEPLHVAVSYGYGPEPEGIAWNQLLQWAQAQNLELRAARFFGFNNPNPTEESPDYGYEQWMTVGPDVQGSETITIKDFPGGLYAVQRVSGVPMPDKWMRLAMWLETSRYRMGEHPWLEECLTPEAFVVAEGAALDLDRLMFDLYLPVA